MLTTTEPQAKVEQTSVDGTFLVEGMEFVCESGGYRYYKDLENARQCCLDSMGNWYLFNEQKNAFEPMAGVGEQSKQAVDAQQARNKEERKADLALRNVERFGIKFDQNGKPVYPRNEKGLFVLPKDDRGAPFFPINEHGRPIFPWDYEKSAPTFPVDDTEEPIFPRNEQNKPIVPKDKNGQPIFPVDRNGSFIFPLDESNCPIPALTNDGLPVIPKDEYGNFVIPKDRDGKPLIHIASDGITPISMAEWKHWKKVYKEQARSFYHQQQQQQQTQAAIETSTASAAYPSNSAFHPFHPAHLQQQSLYFAADMEMLQRVRRVRPEDVDLPDHLTHQQMSLDGSLAGMGSASLHTNGRQNVGEKEQKHKKLLQAQLKAAKIVVPPAATKKREEPKKSNGSTSKEDKKTTKRKEKEQEKTNKKTGPVSSSKIVRKGREERGKREVKRRRRSSSSRSRSHSSRSPQRRSAKRRRKSRSSTYSSRSSYTASSYTGSRYCRSRSSGSRSSSQSQSRPPSRIRTRPNANAPFEEEERIRERLISRTVSSNAAAAVGTNHVLEPEEYGPKPPEEVEKQHANDSDMEMSDEEPPPKRVEECAKVKKTVQQNPAEKAQEHRRANCDEEELPKKPTKVVANERKGPFNVKEVLKSEDLGLVRLCREQEQEKYDQLKLSIAELEVEKSVHKRNWAQLRELEKRLVGRGREKLSSSEDESK